MKPASVLFGSGFVGSLAQQKIVVNQAIKPTIKPVSEKKCHPAKRPCKN
jgi:hypothetical protein